MSVTATGDTLMGITVDTLFTKLHRREKAPIDTDFAKHYNLTFLLREILFSGVVVIAGNKMIYYRFNLSFTDVSLHFRRD